MTEINLKLKIEQIVETSKVNKNDDWVTQQKAVYIGSVEGAAFNLTVTAASRETLDKVIGPGEGQIFIANMRQVAPREVEDEVTSDLQSKVINFTQAVDDLIAVRQERLKFLNERADRILNQPVNYGETVIPEVKETKIMGIGDKINDPEEEQDDDEKLLEELKEAK